MLFFFFFFLIWLGVKFFVAVKIQANRLKEVRRSQEQMQMIDKS